MNGIFDAYMVENGGFLTTADLAFESAEVILDNKFAHLEYEYEKLMMEHEENLKLIELKILTENGTQEDYEYLVMTEAEAVNGQRKGIFAGLFDIIANIFKAIKKFLFGDDFLKDLGDREVNVKFSNDPDKLMKEYDQIEGALKESALKKDINPLKVVFGAIGGTMSGVYLYRKVGKPLIKKLGKYVDQKAIDLNSLGKSVDDANFTGEDANIAKKGIAALRERASKISECLKAVPKALRHDDDFEDTVSRAEDREREEAERPAKEAQAAKEKKAAEKAAKDADKASKKEARAEERAENRALKNEGINPKMKGYIDEIKHLDETETPESLKNTLTTLEANLKKWQNAYKKIKSITYGYTDSTVSTGRQVVDTAKGVASGILDRAKRKITGQTKGDPTNNDPAKHRAKKKHDAELAKNTINEFKHKIAIYKAALKYKEQHISDVNLAEYLNTLGDTTVKGMSITELNSLEVPAYESVLDPDIFNTDNDLTEYFMNEYGYNPLEEDFDALLESAFSLD